MKTLLKKLLENHVKNLKFPAGVIPTWQEVIWMNRMDLREIGRKFSFGVAWLLSAILVALFVMLFFRPDISNPDVGPPVFTFALFLSLIVAVFINAWWEEIFVVRNFPFCSSCGRVVEHRIIFMEGTEPERVYTSLGEFIEPPRGTIHPFCLNCGSQASWQ